MSDTGSRVNSRQTGEGDFWPDEDKPATSRTKLFVAIGAAIAVLVIAGAGAVFLLGGSSGGGAVASAKDSPTPTLYTPSIAAAGTGKLDKRADDRRALNDGEVFGDSQTVKYGKYTFTLAARQVSPDCATAAWGEKLLADLKSFACSQIVRGAYLSQDQQYSGQFIAVNLVSADGAQQIIRDLDPQTSSGFIKPLPGAGIKNFGAAFSAAYAQPYGHYAVVAWVQRNGGVRPDSLNEMIDTSLAVEKPSDFIWERLLLVGG
ncbi:MAG: hypothetical protein JWN00_5092 [Actinomycetia bacterium]|nr:hypothetical protein [Actinomycetes bacterium]